MASTKISLIVPHTFAKQGDYEVSVDGMIAQISISYYQNNKAVDEIMGMISMGTVTLEPDDPEGWSNISKIMIELPYLISSLKSAEDAFSVGLNPSLQSPFKEASLECLKYLNRIIEVIRYCTHRYWMRYLSEAQIKIYEIVLTPDAGKGRQFFNWSPPGDRPVLPIAVLEESSAKQAISGLLLNETKFPTSESLYFDAVQYFSYSRFNESVIYANIALEVFVEEDLRRKFESQGYNEEEVSKKVSKLFSKHISKGGFHNLMEDTYFSRATEENLNPLVQKFEYCRVKRKNSIHPLTTKLTEDEARTVLTNVQNIILWIHNFSDFVH